jgi:hypothetical protein
VNNKLEPFTFCQLCAIQSGLEDWLQTRGDMLTTDKLKEIKLLNIEVAKELECRITINRQRLVLNDPLYRRLG